MRCPKCQYVGFEPSPRCKNCGYDLSLGSTDDRSPDRQDEDAPALTLTLEPDDERPAGDLDLQIFDEVPAKKVRGGAKAFDLDELLANGPSSGRRRQSASASALATPPTKAVNAIFKADAVAEKPAPVPPLTIEPAPAVEPVVIKPAPAPVTTELPLFMQGISEPRVADAPVTPAPAVQSRVPVSIEAAADAMTGDADVDADAGGEVDDRPLVQVPASPRAPLAVRRTTPDPARMRAKYGRSAARSKTDQLETSGDLLLESPSADRLDANLELRAVPPGQRLSAEPTPTSLPADWVRGAGPVKRLFAAALDGALLIGLDAAVIWFTLSVCGLAPAQASLLPVVPLLLFFLLIDTGYLVLFTAACGQTIGKMAAGIRVVGTTTGAVINDRITIAQAVMRSLGSIVSMLPLGAGFWFGLVGDRRSVHDRLAHTRVVPS